MPIPTNWMCRFMSGLRVWLHNHHNITATQIFRCCYSGLLFISNTIFHISSVGSARFFSLCFFTHSVCIFILFWRRITNSLFVRLLLIFIAIFCVGFIVFLNEIHSGFGWCVSVVIISRLAFSIQCSPHTEMKKKTHERREDVKIAN